MICDNCKNMRECKGADWVAAAQSGECSRYNPLSNIVASLRGCIAGNCSNCDYADSGCGRDRLMSDAADLIEQLEDDLRGAHDEIHRLMRSRSKENQNG